MDPWYPWIGISAMTEARDHESPLWKMMFKLSPRAQQRDVNMKSLKKEDSKQKECRVQDPQEEELGPFVHLQGVRPPEGSYQGEWSMR